MMSYLNTKAYYRCSIASQKMMTTMQYILIQSSYMLLTMKCIVCLEYDILEHTYFFVLIYLILNSINSRTFIIFISSWFTHFTNYPFRILSIFTFIWVWIILPIIIHLGVSSSTRLFYRDRSLQGNRLQSSTSYYQVHLLDRQTVLDDRLITRLDKSYWVSLLSYSFDLSIFSDYFVNVILFY